jgi:hypothetical protein
MQPAGNDDVVRYTIVDEVDTAGVHLLLFECVDHPDKRLTSHMLESHMWSMHSAQRFTVSVPSTVSLKEVVETIETTDRIDKGRRGPQAQKYNRPVPGPRQPRRD